MWLALSGELCPNIDQHIFLLRCRCVKALLDMYVSMPSEACQSLAFALLDFFQVSSVYTALLSMDSLRAPVTHLTEFTVRYFYLCISQACFFLIRAGSCHGGQSIDALRYIQRGAGHISWLRCQVT